MNDSTSFPARLSRLRKEGWHGRQSAGAIRREEKRRRRRKQFKILAAVVGVVFLGVAGSHTPVVKKAWAAMAVFDASNLVKNAETAANTIQVLAKTTSILDETKVVKEQTSLVRQFLGTGANVLDQALTKPRNSQGSLLGRSQSVVGAIPDMKRFGIDTSAGSADAQSVIAAVRKGISLEGTSSSGGRYSAVEANRKAYRTAVEEAYGLAVQNRYTAAEVPKKVQDLMAAAEKAAGAEGDLRVQVLLLTSAVGLDIEDRAQSRALDATVAQALMSERIASDTGFLAKDSGAAPAGQVSTGQSNNDLWGK